MWELAMDEIDLDYDPFPWKIFKNSPFTFCPQQTTVWMDSNRKKCVIWTDLLQHTRKMLFVSI